jgi:hypothetical protein
LRTRIEAVVSADSELSGSEEVLQEVLHHLLNADALDAKQKSAGAQDYSDWNEGMPSSGLI